jgi:hypothetical protein
MEANRKLDGDPLSEADAVMAARAELRAQQS